MVADFFGVLYKFKLAFWGGMFLLRVPINTLLKQANFVMMLFSPSGAF